MFGTALLVDDGGKHTALCVVGDISAGSTSREKVTPNPMVM